MCETALQIHSFPPLPCALRTFMTIFCSSMRKARTIFSRTALWERTPPYALREWRR